MPDDIRAAALELVKADLTQVRAQVGSQAARHRVQYIRPEETPLIFSEDRKRSAAICEAVVGIYDWLLDAVDESIQETEEDQEPANA